MTPLVEPQAAVAEAEVRALRGALPASSSAQVAAQPAPLAASQAEGGCPRSALALHRGPLELGNLVLQSATAR